MKSLTSFLVSKNAVTPKALQEVLLNQTIKGGNIGINLLEMGVLKEATLVQLAGKFHRLLVVSLKDLVSIPKEVSGLISKETASRLGCIPFDVERGNVYIACFSPPAKKEENLLRNLTGKTPRFFIASPVALAIAMWIHYGVELSQRMARLIEKINREDYPLIEEIIEGIEESKRAHLLAAVEKKWEMFQALDEKRETLTGFVTSERAGEIQEDAETQGTDLDSAEVSEDDIIDKYIVINRIGARAKRPSPTFVRSPIVEVQAWQREKEEGGRSLAGAPPEAGREAAEQQGVAGHPVERGEGGEIAPPPPQPAPQKEEISTEADTKLREITKKAPPLPIRGFPMPIVGMLTIGEVLARIEASKKASEVIEVVHNYATLFFDFVMMLRYGKGRYEVIMASSKGWGFDIDKLSVKHLYSSTLPETTVSFARPSIFTIPTDHPLATILAECGRVIPPSALLIPISVQEKVVALIYGDNGTGEVRFDEAADLFHVAWMASNRLLAFLVEQKK